ncbi:HAD family hydrolase [Amycolatopsis lurida]
MIEDLRAMPDTLLLWDVDHTLIENGGVSKATYARAFKIITGREAEVRPVTDGRTDFIILHDLLAANGADASPFTSVEQFIGPLTEAMKVEGPRLPEVGYVLPGVINALEALSTVPTVMQSVLTGNIHENAVAKLAPFDLVKYLDLDVAGYGSDHHVRSKLVDIARSKVAAKYGKTFDRDSTILIGDTPMDVKAAHDGGAKVIAVASGRYGVEELRDAGAEATLETLADLDDLIRLLVQLRAA